MPGETSKQKEGTPFGGSSGRRENTFLLAKSESRLLLWLSQRVPRGLLPDDFTLLAFMASVGILVAYTLANQSYDWVWVVQVLLIIHWLGDSMDGTLARFRNQERPRYGYYVDHMADAFAAVAIGLGLGLSPFMLLSVGVLWVVAYLLMSINVYLESSTLGSFDIGYARFGPTEFRLLLFLINIPLALGWLIDISIVGLSFSILDLVGIVVVGVMLLLLLARIYRNVRKLSAEEPGASRRAPRE